MVHVSPVVEQAVPSRGDFDLSPPTVFIVNILLLVFSTPPQTT